MRKKDRTLTYEEFERKHNRLFEKWNSYYKNFAEEEFESLVKYREMIYWDNVAIENDEGVDLKNKGLRQSLIDELVYQLEMDAKDGYMDSKEI